MPPISRRQKKFEQNLRMVQGRNLIAGFLVLLAVVGAFILIRYILPDSKPKLFVSINRVDHSRTREIPYSVDSSEVVKQAFEDHLFCMPIEKVHEVDEQDSRLEIPSGIDSNDILVVYLNGHLTDAKSRPSILANSKLNAQAVETGGTAGGGVADDEIYWVGPESDPVEKKLSKLLESMNNSNAKIKILLLDAGRYSWSPTFPGRESNKFQSRLAEKLKSDAWELTDDFWIITSHSDGEISNVSTPLKRSLFAAAIAESLKSLANDRQNTLQVPKFFQEIKKRTSSYSRNFLNKSLQSPVLMKSKVGVFNVVPNDPEPMVLTWKKLSKPSTDVEKPKSEKYQWRVFAKNADEFTKATFDPENFSALPNESLYRLEMFLEHGEGVDPLSVTETQWLQTYRRDLDAYQEEPQGAITDFNLDTFQQKQQRIRAFRRALFEFSILIRFRNQMRYWDDDAFSRAPLLSGTVMEPFSLSNPQLTEARQISLIENWPAQFKDLVNKNKELLEKVKLKRQTMADTPLLPMQAELLGVLSERYAPLIEEIEANQSRAGPVSDDNESKKTEQSPSTFTLNLTPETATERYDPVPNDSLPGIESVVNLGKREVGNLLSKVKAPETDTSNRFRLAATGSEFSISKQGVVPNISWNDIPRRIAIKSRSSENVFKVPLYQRREFLFDLNTSVVESLDLEIGQPKDSRKLDGLRFGFDEAFDKKKPITDLDGSREFKVYFQYPNPDSEISDEQYSFEIKAIGRKEKTEFTLPFSIKLTKDAVFTLAIKRVIANLHDDRSFAPLYRWGRAPTEAEWKNTPLTLLTLANVKSKFEFSLSTTSEESHEFRVKLFQIKEFPNDIKENLLTSDRDDVGQIKLFVDWLDQQSTSEGTPPLERNDFFELLGVASNVQLAKEGNATIRFLPPPKDPDADDEKPPSELAAIEHGVIVAFYSGAEKDPDANKHETPIWYQLLFFRPQEPANTTALKQTRLKLKPDIIDRFGKTDIKLLPKLLVATVDQEPAVEQAVKLTIVSKAALDENKNEVRTLKLQDVIAGDGSAPSPGNSPAFLMLDLFGLPNYMTYETDGINVSSTGFRSQLTGIRIRSHPANWDCYPNSWSFASNKELGGFEWLAKRPNVRQDIYVKIGPGDGGDARSGQLELFLPFRIGGGSVLVKTPNDFMVNWKKRDQTFRYPNERKHFASISESGLTAWSQVTSHSIPISDIKGEVLQIFRDGDEKPLGEWRFVTESPNTKPKLTSTKNKLVNRPAEILATKITLDTTNIRPPIDPASIKLSLDEVELDQKKLKRFLADNRKEPGLYEFSLKKLRTVFGLKAKDPFDVNTVIEAEVTDFFEETPLPARLQLTITEPMKKKPKPKPTTLEVSFSEIGDMPVNLRSFSSVQLNDKRIPLNRATEFNGSTIKIEPVIETPSLKITGLLPGIYSIQVSGLIKRENAAQYTPALATQSRITVPEAGEKAEGAKVTLTFK